LFEELVGIDPPKWRSGVAIDLGNGPVRQVHDGHGRHFRRFGAGRGRPVDDRLPGLMLDRFEDLTGTPIYSVAFLKVFRERRLTTALKRIYKDQPEPRHHMPPKSKKDSSLIIRLPKADRDDFVALCEKTGTSASRELREHIQKFIKKNSKKGSSS